MQMKEHVRPKAYEEYEDPGVGARFSKLSSPPSPPPHYYSLSSPLNRIAPAPLPSFSFSLPFHYPTALSCEGYLLVLIQTRRDSVPLSEVMFVVWQSAGGWLSEVLSGVLARPLPCLPVYATCTYVCE